MPRSAPRCRPPSAPPSTRDSPLQFGGSGLAHANPLWPLRPAAGAPKRQRDGKTRVLILMSDTGGGHRASAEALKAGASGRLLGAGSQLVAPLNSGRQSGDGTRRALPLVCSDHVPLRLTVWLACCCPCPCAATTPTRLTGCRV